MGHWAVRVALCISLLFVYFSCQCYCSLYFAVLLNCPYGNARVFCLFSSHSLPHPSAGGGATEQPRGPLLPAIAKLQEAGLPLVMEGLERSSVWAFNVWAARICWLSPKPLARQTFPQADCVSEQQFTHS